MLSEIFFGKVKNVKEPDRGTTIAEKRMNIKEKIGSPSSMSILDKLGISGGGNMNAIDKIKAITGNASNNINPMDKIKNITGSAQKKNKSDPTAKIMSMIGKTTSNKTSNNFSMEKLRQFTGSGNINIGMGKTKISKTSNNFSMEKLRQFTGGMNTSNNSVNKVKQIIGTTNPMSMSYRNISYDGTSRNAVIHKVANFVSGKGYTQSLSQDQADERKKAESERKNYEKRIRAIEIERQRREAAANLAEDRKLIERDNFATKRGQQIISYENAPQNARELEAQRLLQLKQNELIKAQGGYTPGREGWIEGIRDIGAFGGRGLETARQTGIAMGGHDFSTKMSSFTQTGITMGGHNYESKIASILNTGNPQLKNIDTQINIARMTGQKDKVEQLLKDRGILASQVSRSSMPVMFMGGFKEYTPQQPIQQQSTYTPQHLPANLQFTNETTVVEGVTFYKLVDGRWYNGKTGKIVTYTRGKYDRGTRRNLQPQIYPQQPMYPQ